MSNRIYGLTEGQRRIKLSHKESRRKCPNCRQWFTGSTAWSLHHVGLRPKCFKLKESQ